MGQAPDFRHGETIAHDKRVRPVLNDLLQKSTFSNREHLPAFWIEAEGILGEFPDKYIWLVAPSDQIASWVIDTTSLNAWYWSDIVKRINALLFFHATKFKTLLEAIDQAAAQDNLLVLVMLLRSLFEYCATLFVFSELVDKKLKGFDLGRLSHETVVEKEFEDELIVFSHGSRFNWQELLTGDVCKWINASEDVKPEHRQKNILGRIEKVAKEQRYGAFRLMYAWLCDYVHPNFGSHMLYVRNETVVEHGVVRIELRRSASGVVI